MVQNSYTKAVKNSDMPPKHSKGQQANYDEWVENLQHWFGKCHPTYRTAKEARMALSTLPAWLKGTMDHAEATRHQRTAPNLKEL